MTEKNKKMYKLNKIRGFVALPILIGGAVIAAGLVGGLIYKYENNQSVSSIVNKDKMLAQVSGVTAPTITVTSPNGGEIFSKGDKIKISWSGGKNKVQIALVNPSNEAVPMGWITSNAVPNSSIEWDGVYIKNALGNIGFSVPSGDYKILAVSEDPDGEYCISCAGSSCHGCNVDYSDATFNFDAGSNYQSVMFDLSAKAPISTISTGLSDLGNKVDVLNNGESKEKIDVLFIPANVADISLFKNTIEDILYKETKMPSGYDKDGNITYYDIRKGFLNVEPFKTYKNKFNISYVDKNINEALFNCLRDMPDPTKPAVLQSFFGCDSNKIKEAYKVFNPDYIVVAFNYPGFSSSAGEIMYLDLSAGSHIETLAWQFTHEFGHQFGGFLDLYNDINNTRDDIMAGGLEFDKISQDHLKLALDCCYPRKDTVECNAFRDKLKNATTGLDIAYNKIISCGVVSSSGVSTSTTQTQTQTSTIQPTIVQTSATTPAGSGLSSIRVQAILGMLQSFEVSESIINNVRYALTGVPVSGSNSNTQTSSVATPSASSATSASAVTVQSTSTGTFSYAWNNDLYYGITNNADVRALQQALTIEGVYSGPVNGNFWSLTRQAVIDFQNKHNFTNIPGTGYVGSYTRQVLNDLYSK